MFARTLKALRRIKYSFRFSTWLWVQWRRRAQIHRTVEFLGMPAYDHIEIGEMCDIACYSSLYVHTGATRVDHLKLGDRVGIGRNVNIAAYAPISIGDDTMIAPYCHILSGNHVFDRRDIPISKQPMRVEEVTIEEEVWIGTHVVVLPGAHIGKGAIIGANSVVNKKVGPWEIWAGSPAKFIKMRPD